MITFAEHKADIKEMMAEATSKTVTHSSYEAGQHHDNEHHEHLVSQGYNKTHSRHMVSHGGGNSYYGRKTIYKHPDGRQVTVHNKSVVPHAGGAHIHTTTIHNKD